MENKILVLPESEEELVAMYLPDGEKSQLLREFRLLLSYLQNKLHPHDPQYRELRRLTIPEVRRRREILKKEIFCNSILSFANRACEEQREICMMSFYAAPCVDEAEWIGNSRMPDIYLRGEYEQLNTWWSGLSRDSRETIARDNVTMYPEEEYAESSNDPDVFWSRASLDTKRELLREYSGKQSSS